VTGTAADEALIVALLRLLAPLDEAGLQRFLKALPTPVQRALHELWAWQAHGAQREPAGDWRVWLMLAGRGFGKTQAGAEWIAARAREMPGARIALVAATLDDAARVMIEGPSGLLSIARADERDRVRWLSTKGVLTFASGAEAFVYSGEKPSRLRGPEHHFAWCDELAKWRHPDATWDMLTFGLRRGERPRAVITTTPATVPALVRIMALERTAVGRGRTIENAHLSADYLEAVTRLYGGTRLGRQELDGEYLEDVEQALWPRALIEQSRAPAPERAALRRVVIGVDPPASAGGDACGIVACGLSEAGIGYVLGDLSVAGLSPEGWARAVADAAAAWGADRVIAEANNGGAMVAAVLRGAAVALPIRLVHAAAGKAARAEPVAALFENGRARLGGRFPALEDELAGLSVAGAYRPALRAGGDGPGRSPDRADAMVWALWALLIEAPPRSEPRIRSL
jgi:phage terminase large subunit-like protein